jgi:hypothetical protein
MTIRIQVLLSVSNCAVTNRPQNRYGDASDTTYAGGTPQFEESTGYGGIDGPMKPLLTAPGARRLKLKYDEALSNCVVNVNLRHCNGGDDGPLRLHPSAPQEITVGGHCRRRAGSRSGYHRRCSWRRWRALSQIGPRTQLTTRMRENFAPFIFDFSGLSYHATCVHVFDHWETIPSVSNVLKFRNLHKSLANRFARRGNLTRVSGSKLGTKTDLCSQRRRWTGAVRGRRARRLWP